MKRLLREYPQEASLLAVDFEETAAIQREQQFEHQQQMEQHRRNSRTSDNLGGPGGFEVEESIGDDDEVDWHDASRGDAPGEVQFENAEEGTE